MNTNLLQAQDSLTLESTEKDRFKTISSELNISLYGTGKGHVPFWMRSNQFGSVPLDGFSTSLSGRIQKDYNPLKKKNSIDWGFGTDLRLNIGDRSEFIPVEAYLKGKAGAFQLKVGRSKDISGLVDSTLSSGSFSISGNALGVPKIELSIPEFWSLPFTHGVFSIKGNFSFGLMGDALIQYGDNKGELVKTYFHSKSFHGRVGKPEWKLKFYGGVNHQVVYGSDKFIFGDQYDLSTLNALYHVVTGKKYRRSNARDISKIGNHLGAIDFGFDVELPNTKIFAYRQAFYDKGALYYLANIADGLTGLAISNKRTKKSNWHWQKFLIEMFYSKNQAGEEGAKETPSGPEHYYNHGVYTEGYSYKQLGIGNPFITRAADARPGLPNNPINYFINNRVMAFHLGNQGIAYQWTYTIKLSYSKNWGEYDTSDVEYFWYNGGLRKRTPSHGIFKEVNQFSGYLQAEHPLKNGFYLSLMLAIDNGTLLYDSLGGSVKLSKRW